MEVLRNKVHRTHQSSAALTVAECQKHGGTGFNASIIKHKNFKNKMKQWIMLLHWKCLGLPNARMLLPALMHCANSKVLYEIMPRGYFCSESTRFNTIKGRVGWVRDEQLAQQKPNLRRNENRECQSCPALVCDKILLNLNSPLDDWAKVHTVVLQKLKIFCSKRHPTKGKAVQEVKNSILLLLYLARCIMTSPYVCVHSVYK